MKWLSENAAAIQALTSVGALLLSLTLAVLTAWYVRLTRALSKAAVDQVALMKDMSTDARRQMVMALVATCNRIRMALAALHGEGPSFRQLKDLAQLSALDVADINRFAFGVNDECVSLASAVSGPLRVLLRFHENVKTIPDGQGWIANRRETTEYLGARDEAIRQLSELEQLARKSAN